MDKTLLDFDRAPTLDELREFFKSNDWSSAVPQEIEAEESDATEAVLYIQKLMDEHFEPISREKGLSKASVYFGKNNPLIALRNNTENLVSTEVARLIAERPEVAEQILSQFDFSDPDIDEKADEFLHNAVDTMLDTMNYEAIAEIVNNAPAHEDFSRAPNNHAKQDFRREYYRSSSKGFMESLEAVTLDGQDESQIASEDIDAIQRAENCADAARAFWNTLDTDEKKLLRMRIGNCTYKQIADELKLKTSNAVSKRRQKIAEKFVTFYKEKYED